MRVTNIKVLRNGKVENISIQSDNYNDSPTVKYYNELKPFITKITQKMSSQTYQQHD